MQDSPEAHYDRVTAAWRYLMGENFHYGYFRQPGADLGAATGQLIERMVEHGQLASGQQVLDVGCGIGSPALHLAEHLGCRVTGISTSREGLALAEQRARERGLGELLDFRHADGMDNGLPEARFDRVWVMESSHLMPDKEKLLSECRRVLRPGGRMVLCDIVAQRELLMKDVLRHAKRFNVLRLVYGRAKMETLTAYRGWCEARGLEVDHCQDISQAVRPTFDAWQANAARHEAEVVELIGRQAFDHFVESCDILRFFWAEQMLGYGLLAARAT